MVNFINKLIYNYKKFNSEISIRSEKFPLYILHYNNNKDNKIIISQYLKSINIYTNTYKGTVLYFNKFINYKFNYKNYFMKKNIYKLLFYTFKGMYSLISRPIFIYKSNKIILRFFYFIVIPTFLKNKNYFKFKKFNKIKYKYK